MYEGNMAKIRMDRNLIIGGTTADILFDCKISNYDETEENILLVLQGGNLEDLSLNAVYQCEIQEAENAVLCTGIIVDRCCTSEGKIVKMKIQNGFYKINIK